MESERRVAIPPGVIARTLGKAKGTKQSLERKTFMLLVLIIGYLKGYDLHSVYITKIKVSNLAFEMSFYLSKPYFTGNDFLVPAYFGQYGGLVIIFIKEM